MTDKKFQNDRRLIATALRQLANQIETSTIDGFQVSWTVGDKVMKSETKRLPAKETNVVNLSKRRPPPR